MKPYRAAVVGCGLIGSRFAQDAERIGVYTHAGAYAAHPRTELCALCDADAGALAEAGALWPGAVCFSDPARMVAEARPEIVSICTPDATHASLLRQVLAAESVRAVFAEKPLALDLQEAREIVALAGAKPMLINYARRFATNHQALKTRLDAGAIGTIVAVRGIYTKGLRHNGTHWIDLAHWLVGEITGVQAFDVLRESGPDPTLDVRINFRNGATGTLAGVPASNYSIFEMELLGASGRARITDSGWSVDLAVAGESSRYSGYRALGDPQPIEGDLRDLGLRAVENLTAHLDNPRSPLACTSRDGLTALAVADAAQRSVITGRVEVVAS